MVSRSISRSHYRWSSYRAHAEGRPDPLVKDHPRFLALGRREADPREAYKALFKAALDDDPLRLLRETVSKGWALGSDRLRAKIEAATRRQAQPRPWGGPGKGAGRPKMKRPQSDRQLNRV